MGCVLAHRHAWSTIDRITVLSSQLETRPDMGNSLMARLYLRGSVFCSQRPRQRRRLNAASDPASTWMGCVESTCCTHRKMPARW
jgi:hypothetical protein